MVEKSFLDRIKDEVLVGVPATNKACQTCLFAHGEAPWADTPMKGNCMIYERDEGQNKPANICFDGADCEFYEKDAAV